MVVVYSKDNLLEPRKTRCLCVACGERLSASDGIFLCGDCLKRYAEATVEESARNYGELSQDTSQ